MKPMICLLLIALSQKLNATNYYLSASGNDNNAGTSVSAPWLSISKLNSTVLQPGDSVFFRCGDVFRGQVNVQQSGTSMARIVFTSYGNGAKPVISGAKVITGWIVDGARYYAPETDSIAYLYLNGQAQQLARYPNAGTYLTLDSAQLSYLRDQSLTGLAPNLLQGSICIHTAQWCWEKSAISSASGDRINFTTPVHLKGLANYGYFLYNNLAHLDAAGEWFYDDAAARVYYQTAGGTNPNSLNLEGAVLPYGFYLSAGVSNISISGLDIRNQYKSGIDMVGNNNRYLRIDNCAFSGQYLHGVSDRGRYTEISNSTFRAIDGIAIFVQGAAFGGEIHHNVLRNIGQFRESGMGTEINLSAITIAFTDSSYIHHNNIDSTGYCGISADGGYHLIERNIVSNAMLKNNDGAALKTFGGNSHDIIFRNNFVSKSDGNTEGAANANFITPAIYFDFEVNHSLIENNTVYDRTQKGIFQNSGNNNNTLRGNVIFGCNYGIDLNGSPIIQTPITGMHVTRNVIFASDQQSYMLRQVDYTNTFNTGIIDSNYYFQPYDANHYVWRVNGTMPTVYSFASWQATGNDLHTQATFTNYNTATFQPQLFMNQTDDVLVFDLGTTQYLDVDSNLVCGSLSLDPYTSQVLIDYGASCPASGVDELPGADIRIYPNPANDAVHLEFPFAVNSLKIIDLRGNTLMEIQHPAKHLMMDVAHWASGCYLIVAEHNGGIITRQLIRE